MLRDSTLRDIANSGKGDFNLIQHIHVEGLSAEEVARLSAREATYAIDRYMDSRDGRDKIYRRANKR